MAATHSQIYWENTFRESAGLEELKHLYGLVSELTDKELKALVGKIGIKFIVPEKLLDRFDFEGAVDKADREDFYREYNKILKLRKK